MGEHKARMRAWMKNHRLRVRATALGLLLSAAFMGAATLAIARDSAADRYERYLESVYSASFYDLRDHLDGVEVKLGKLMVVQSPQAQAQLLEDIYRHSEAVQQCVALLPECLGAFSGTMAFVNRLGDYSHQLSLQALQGVQLTETDRTQLQELRTQCGAFCREARAGAEL